MPSPDHSGPEPQRTARHRRGFFRRFGPGLITGASDDDPSGIATYSQAGAQFGFSTLWTMVLTYPLMVAVQLISGQIGRVTGVGIAGNMKKLCPRWLVILCMAAIVGANTINIAADVSAMGAALQLLLGGPAKLYAALFGGCSLLLQVFLSYTRYVKILKWLTLALFSYVITAFVVDVPWLKTLRETLLPNLPFSYDYFTVLAAILGTTISPYLFFWQAAQEVEEVRRVRADQPLLRAPAQAKEQLKRISADTFLGMGVSNVVAFFIILTAAVVLNANHKIDIRSAADAAEALRPLAGQAAFLLFSVGIIGTGMLALPVLAGSVAYGVGETMGWKSGLAHRPKQAPRFYCVLAAVMIVGIALNFVHLDPMKALFWAAVVNGLVAPPFMIILLKIGSSRKIMQAFTISNRLKVTGWIATGLMTLVAALSVVGWFRGKS